MGEKNNSSTVRTILTRLRREGERQLADKWQDYKDISYVEEIVLPRKEKR
jgi:hypothetical protein